LRSSNASAGAPPTPVETPAALDHTVAAPIDLLTPQFTLRAVLTGMVLGGLLSACNIYAGLAIGFSTNMSIVAVLLSYAFWSVVHMIFGTRPWTILENNINQAGASAGAAVSSAGLVAPIPALAMLTGQELSWGWLAVWVFSVCIVGITVAIPIRRTMIVHDKLPFPSGIATAQTLVEIYARGREAFWRVLSLGIGAVVSGIVLLMTEYTYIQYAVLWPLGWASRAAKLDHISLSFIPAAWLYGFEAKSLTFTLNPNLLMVGIGGIVGFRTSLWLLVGAILAWLVIAPPLIDGNVIRLPIRESLLDLPTEVRQQLAREPAAFMKYKPESSTLEFAGIMSAAERDKYLAISEAENYRNAVRRIYTRSQLKLGAPLDALPGGLSPDGLPVRFDAQRKLLRPTQPLSREDLATLVAASSDPTWKAAVATLTDFFSFGTTTAIHFEVPLKLTGFPSDVTIPRAALARLSFQQKESKLVATGVLSDDLLNDLLHQISEAKPKHPGESADYDLLRAALVALRDQSRVPILTPDQIPASQASLFRYDSEDQTLHAFGVLTTTDEKQLAAIDAPNKRFAASIAALRKATLVASAQPNFGDVMSWLLWPGVTLMVVSSLVSFAFSWKSIGRSFSGLGGSVGTDKREETGEMPTNLFVGGLLIALVLSVTLQIHLFAIVWWAAVLGVLASFVLAIVGARVSGETNNTPVGAMGKVTQLLFGVLVPQNPAPNLMAANVTGGAASQCADLMHDLKTGYMLGAIARYQAFSQFCGALAGSLLGALWYKLLIPHPAQQLMTSDWPAPAVATWKAVAELFMVGLEALPAGATTAMLIAGIVGLIMPILEKLLPRGARVFVPSCAAVGLAFVINAHHSVSMFIGGTIALILSKTVPNWTARFLIVICSGIAAGESLTGVGVAIEKALNR
jgi:uncharacterized oligopeptide transporter (OPT) family protein